MDDNKMIDSLEYMLNYCHNTDCKDCICGIHRDKVHNADVGCMIQEFWCDLNIEDLKYDCHDSNDTRD